MRQTLSLFNGVTTPVRELYEQIERYGWNVSKLAWDPKSNAYKAEGQDAQGQATAKTGPDPNTALANLLVAIARRTHLRTSAQYKVGMWKTMFTDQLKDIAEAYSEAPVYDPKAAIYFKELADDSTRRANVLRQQLHVEVTDNPEPYANAQEMAQDIHKNKHFLVSRANCDHPIWSVEQIVAFRVVHDVLGHAVSGGDFGWQGENLACAAHFPLLTPTAQLALFTECIAQTAYAAYYRSFGPQKIAIFPQFIEGAQSAENPAAHRGVHPSQSVAPEAMPEIPASPPPYEKGYVAPHRQPQGLQPLTPPTFSKVASLFSDPNEGWDSGIAPLDPEYDVHPETGQPMGNAYLHHSDPLESNKVMDNAGLIDTQWHQLGDREQMKKAVVNAFRVVLLSPKKHLYWNAVHYQDIADIPGSVSDPMVYWNTLDKKRQEWNIAQTRKHYTPDIERGELTPRQVDEIAEKARYSHQAWRKLYPRFFSYVLGYTGDHAAAEKKAQRMIFDWTTDEEIRIAMAEEKKPEEKQLTQDEIERKAQAAMVKRMKLWMEDNKPKMDSLFGRTAKEDNYIDELATKILNECSEQEIPDGFSHEEIMTLFREYALLALTKGRETTAEDVHDAWSAWMAEHEADHESLKPFDELKPEIQAYDEPYAKYIRKHASDPMSLGFDVPFVPKTKDLRPKIVRYGAFMGTHLKAIAQISQHADEILDAAIKDVEEKDGAGHHFRAVVLALNVSGVGPKVCSFAWLLLQPLTSQLATIDTHMLDVLGHSEKEMTPRDYFKFERELQAGRDAAGYGGIPMGAFQWGMWDYKRTGAGSHQDHSAMKVLDPIHHWQIDWADHAQPMGPDAQDMKANWAKNAPDWWRNTEPARMAVAQDFDQNIAPNFKRDEIPYQITDDTMTRAASFVTAGESKDEFHVGFTLPEELFEKLVAIADSLPIRKEKPENYHITGFWTEHGFERQELHRWIKNASVSGLHFTNARIECFPSNATDDKWAIVLRLDSPEAKKLMNKLMDEAEEEYDLEIKRFDGGWKAHITLGWSDEEVESQKFPEIDFRTGPLYVSIPRPLREAASHMNRRTAAPKELTKMQRYRLLHNNISTPEIWKLYPEGDDDGHPSSDRANAPTGSEAQGSFESF